MPVKLSSHIKTNNPSHFGRFIAEECAKKNIRNDYLAKKLNIGEEDVVRLKQCRYIYQFFSEVNVDTKEESDLILKKLSGITGVCYRQLRRIAGHERTKNFVPNFWTEDGEQIDEQEILSKIYYQNPKEFLTKLKSLIEA
ncbi:hypothetical protein IKF84_01630 [Candidatus Saccharibacteria bacterium]|nr:hypothetical protein [Candidatus Saccharibacteria bacterium]